MFKRKKILAFMMMLVALGVATSAYCASPTPIQIGGRIQNILYKGYLNVQNSTGPIPGSGAPATVDGIINDGPSWMDSTLTLNAEGSFVEVISSSQASFIPVRIRVSRISLFESPQYGKNRKLIEKRYIGEGFPVELRINNGASVKVKGSFQYLMNQGKGNLKFWYGTKKFDLQVEGKKSEIIIRPLIK